MPLQLYNTLTRKKEDFVPLDPKAVRMYTCGPTVYNYPHIGNYRAYVFADTLKRSLQYLGHHVDHVMNITDVDDKTIRDSVSVGKTLREFTEFYTEAFMQDIHALNILPPKKFTKATDYVHEMVAMIEKLLEKGLAYKSEDGSVYYNIKKFSSYGKLSGATLAEQKENAAGRIKTDEYDKDNIQDFALWKAWDEKDGDVYWETGLGKGRPGWHIECSAMSIANLGESIDIHTGGVDLIFPHHENEIAQSEGATGKDFVKYWIHNEWLLVDGKKMAKSAGNFYTLRDIMEKGISPLGYRFWLLMANYGTRVNFVFDTVMGANEALKRLHGLYVDLGVEIGKPAPHYTAKFKEFLEDDLDTPRAVALLWEAAKDEKLSPAEKRATMLDFDRVLGLGLKDLKALAIPEEVKALVAEREAARTAKDFKLSDELRDKIVALGYSVKDTDTGQKISKI